jgi:hypothetical protein
VLFRSPWLGLIYRICELTDPLLSLWIKKDYSML